MSSRRRTYAPARVVTVVALAAAALVVALLMFGAFDDSYQVKLRLDNASQLVNGNEVKVGGFPVGTVSDIKLGKDDRAVVTLDIDDDEIAPLHEGTKAVIRQTSLSSIAGRSIALQPGPNNEPEIPDGGEIRYEDTQGATDLDAILNTLDPNTTRELQTAVRRSADIYGKQSQSEIETLGAGAEPAVRAGGDASVEGSVDQNAVRNANRALLALNPALSQASITFRQLTEDERSLERFIVDSADVVSQISSREGDLSELTANAGGALGAIAQENRALESILAQLPPTLRKTNTSLVNLRATLKDVAPAIDEARPSAPLLSEFLTRLRPLSRDARAVLPQLRRTIDRRGTREDLLGVLDGLNDVSKEADPSFESTVKLTNDALVLARDTRPYVPDLIGGFVNGFGNAVGGYYDANGHYARISFAASLYSLSQSGSLLPLPPSQQGLTGYRKDLDKRCPGASTQTLPDRSNPYRDGRGNDFPCDIEDSPR